MPHNKTGIIVIFCAALEVMFDPDRSVTSAIESIQPSLMLCVNASAPVGFAEVTDLERSITTSITFRGKEGMHKINL